MYISRNLTYLFLLMVRIAILFSLVLFPVFASAQLNVISKKVNAINEIAFSLKDNDLEKASNKIAEAFPLLRDKSVETIIRSNSYNVAGTIEFQRGNYKKALAYFLHSLRIRATTDSANKIADSYLNIANLYCKIENFQRAIHNYKQCIYYRQLLKGSNLNIIATYNGLSLAYESNYQVDSALYYYNKALDIVNNLADKNTLEISNLYCNLGQLYETNGQYEKALLYLQKAFKIQQKVKDLYGTAWVFHHIGIVNENLKQTNAAKNFYHKAENLAMKLSDLEIQRDIAKSWTLLYAKEHNTDSVNYYFERFELLNDSFNLEISKQNILELDAKYQTEKKDRQIALNKAEKNNMMLAFILGSIIIVSILAFLIRNYRQKQRIALMQVDLKSREINELLTQQETASYAAMLEGQDQERFRIAQDLHDRLGSTLAAVKLGMQGDPVATNTYNQELVDTAISEVRAIAHNLSGGNIERYGLNVALNELKTTIEQSGQMQVNLYLEPISAGNQLHIELYRIVQELVSNTLKHASATEITIQTSDHQQHLNLIYEDNGTGFDPSAMTPGMGIRNIQHRLKKWDGTLEIDSQTARGTIVIIDIPKTTHS